jgi:hypothetical protein
VGRRPESRSDSIDAKACSRLQEEADVFTATEDDELEGGSRTESPLVVNQNRHEINASRSGGLCMQLDDIDGSDYEMDMDVGDVPSSPTRAVYPETSTAVNGGLFA